MQRERLVGVGLVVGVGLDENVEGGLAVLSVVCATERRAQRRGQPCNLAALRPRIPQPREAEAAQGSEPGGGDVSSGAHALKVKADLGLDQLRHLAACPRLPLPIYFRAHHVDVLSKPRRAERRLVVDPLHAKVVAMYRD